MLKLIYPLVITVLAGPQPQAQLYARQSAESSIQAQYNQAADTTAISILEKAITAAGGLERFKAVQNLMIVTESELGRSKTALTVTETMVLPDKTKQVMQLANGSRTQVLYGNQSWKQINDDAASPLSALEKREMERGLFRDIVNLFKNFGGPDLRLRYQGEETIGGETAHLIEVKNQSGDFFDLYVDAKTNLIRKKTYRGAPEVGLANMEEIYSDYRKVDGLLIPHLIVVKVNGQDFTKSEVIDVAFNAELAADFFLTN